MDSFRFFSLIVLVNLIPGWLLAYAARRVTRREVRHAFLLYLINCLLWTNAGLLLRQPWIGEEWREFFTRFALGSSVTLVNALSLFFLTVAGEGVRELRRTGFRLLQGAGLLFFLLAFTPLLLLSIRLIEGEPRVRFGPLFPVLVLFLTLHGTYIFHRMKRLMDAGEDRFTRTQIRMLYLSGAVSFVILLTDKGILPALTGKSETLQYGFLAFLFQFLGILYILINGESILLFESARDLLQKLSLSGSDNFRSLLSLLHLLGERLNGGEKPRLRYRTLPGGSVLVRFHEEYSLPEKDGTGSRSGISPLLADRSEKREKKAVTPLLSPSPPMASLSWTPPGVSCTGVLLRQNIPLEDYREEILKNLKQSRDLFGTNLLCFSLSLFETLKEMERMARSPYPVLFCGETGTGRTQLVRSMHHMRGGGSLREISLPFVSIGRLEREIRRFLNSDERNPPGLLIKHLETLSVDAGHLFEPLLEGFEHRRYVYFTAPERLPPLLRMRADSLFFALEPMRITLAPLRDRPEDLFHQLLWFLLRSVYETGSGVQSVPASVLRSVMEYYWPGNSLELERAVTAAVLRSTGDRLHLEPTGEEMAQSAFSPLEESERRVILEHLARNNFNKSKTVRDLKITVNTLKAKMSKYNIAPE